MESITLKEIAGYLPYGLKVKSGNYTIRNLVIETESYLSQEGNISIKSLLNGIGHRPILHNLSMLTDEVWKEINIASNGMVNLKTGFGNWSEVEFEGKKMGVQALPFYVIQILQKHHYDIWGLIERCLAIDKSKTNV